MTEETRLILEKLDKMDTRISALDERISNLESSMNTKITDLRLTLENETNRNIKLIAEGHLDLSRKLDDALKVKNEKELLLIRVNTLENEVRKIKMRLEEIV